MRLIDADALKKALDEQMHFEENCRDSVFDIIDNATTIIWCSENSDGLPLMDLRPRQKGEWIIDQEEYKNAITLVTCTCPFCGERHCCKMNFCGNCGADMRGDDNGLSVQKNDRNS